MNNAWQGTHLQRTQILTERLAVEPGDDPEREATIVAEPLERGFGLTLGNALRQVLLSSLQGAAITSVQINGVLHEFSSVPGVREDVTDMVLNIKGIALRMRGDGPKRVALTATGPGEVTAGQIETGHDIEVMNPRHVICTLDEGAKLSMEMSVETGKGYVSGASKRPPDAPIGLIPVDALFSPVRRVAYKVENSRVGQVTDYDKLSMRIETNGAITPEDAVALAARILQSQLQLFINFEKPVVAGPEKGVDDPPISPILLLKVDVLALSLLLTNCLKYHKINYIGDLVQKTESEMLQTPNVGGKFLNEIKETLAKMGLHLGTKILNWPPENIEELAREFEELYWRPDMPRKEVQLSEADAVAIVPTVIAATSTRSAAEILCMGPLSTRRFDGASPEPVEFEEIGPTFSLHEISKRLPLVDHRDS